MSTATVFIIWNHTVNRIQETQTQFHIIATIKTSQAVQDIDLEVFFFNIGM